MFPVSAALASPPSAHAAPSSSEQQEVDVTVMAWAAQALAEGTPYAAVQHAARRLCSTQTTLNLSQLQLCSLPEIVLPSEVSVVDLSGNAGLKRIPYQMLSQLSGAQINLLGTGVTDRAGLTQACPDLSWTWPLSPESPSLRDYLPWIPSSTLSLLRMRGDGHLLYPSSRVSNYVSQGQGSSYVLGPSGLPDLGPLENWLEAPMPSVPSALSTAFHALDPMRPEPIEMRPLPINIWLERNSPGQLGQHELLMSVVKAMIVDPPAETQPKDFRLALQHHGIFISKRTAQAATAVLLTGGWFASRARREYPVRRDSVKSVQGLDARRAALRLVYRLSGLAGGRSTFGSNSTLGGSKARPA